jgi:hypothetical protein
MKTLYILVILAILTSPCFAGTFEIDRAGDATQFQLYVEKPLTDKVGAFAYNCQSKVWGQTRVGLTYAPISSLKIGFGAGIETGGSRIGGSIWAGRGKFSGIYFLESGPGGTWDKLVVKYQTTEKFALGWTKKQFAGQGVYADFRISDAFTLKFSGFKTREIAIQIDF